MNREILFRGKDYRGKWVFGHYAYFVNYPDSIKMHWILDAEAEDDIDPATLGQYTGLQDVNGVKIFEGDIVETNDYSRGIALTGNQKMKRCIVRFYNGKFILNNPMVKLSNGDVFQGGTEIPADPIPHKTIIIGNIHDNPELL